MTPSPMPQWDVHLSSWIVQDGNYDDFYQGQIATFALEARGPVQRGNISSKAAQRVGDARYRVQGEVLYLGTMAWVIDFGIRAYREDAMPEGVEAGMFVIGEVELGIDYYAYMEFLHKQPAIPALMYTWRIDRSSQLSAPFIPTMTPWGTPAQARDMSRASYQDIDRTQAWEDDDGHAEYILHCTLVDPEPAALHKYPFRS